MALHVDKSKPNGLDEFLIASLNNILIAITCHLPIDETQFKKFGLKTITQYYCGQKERLICL